MIELGYEPCSEEPWTDRQGQSSFVWSMLDPIAQVTERITIDTAVTCPNIRIHPAIAQAARRQLLSGRNRYLDKLRKYEEVECSRVFIHQIGSDQPGFFRFCERELLPRLALSCPGDSPARAGRA